MNLHTHTSYCDGKSAPEEYIAKAIALQWKYLGFSAHAPLPFRCDWCIPLENLTAYCEEIGVLQKKYHSKKLHIFHGFEIDYLTHAGYPSLEHPQICSAQYFICSIHYLPNIGSKTTQLTHRYYEIDGTYAQFMLALKNHEYSLKKLLTRYIEATENMITTPVVEGKIKILGHVDKIVINAMQLPEFDGLSDWFYAALADVIISNRVHFDFMEINTRAIYKKGLSQPYPRVTFIEQMEKNQVPMIINSDAHQPSELPSGYPECLAQIEAHTNVNISKILRAWLH